MENEDMKGCTYGALKILRSRYLNNQIILRAPCLLISLLLGMSQNHGQPRARRVIRFGSALSPETASKKTSHHVANLAAVQGLLIILHGAILEKKLIK